MNDSDKKKFKWISLFIDLTGICGLGMLGTGLWWYDPKISLIVMGLIMVFFAIVLSSIIAKEKMGHDR